MIYEQHFVVCVLFSRKKIFKTSCACIVLHLNRENWDLFWRHCCKMKLCSLFIFPRTPKRTSCCVRVFIFSASVWNDGAFKLYRLSSWMIVCICSRCRPQVPTVCCFSEVKHTDCTRTHKKRKTKPFTKPKFIPNHSWVVSVSYGNAALMCSRVNRFQRLND